jgi:hypothetical protein
MNRNLFFSEDFFNITPKERDAKKPEFHDLLKKNQAGVAKEIVVVLLQGDKEKNNILHDFIASSVTMGQWKVIKQSVWKIPLVSDKKKESWAMLLNGFIRI